MPLTTVAGSQAVADLLGANWDNFVSAVENLPADAKEEGGVDEATRNAQVQLRALMSALRLGGGLTTESVTAQRRAHLTLSYTARIMADGFGARAGAEMRTAFLRACELELLEPALRAVFDRTRSDMGDKPYVPSVSD